MDDSSLATQPVAPHRKLWSDWLTALFDLFFPPLCPVCGLRLGDGRRDPLCGGCWRSIEPIAAPYCIVCGTPFFAFGPRDERHRCEECRRHRPPFAYARSIARYGGVIREALHAFKFDRVTALERPLGNLMAEVGRGMVSVEEITLLVPIPLHRSRQSARGFNQAELLARRLGKVWKIPVGQRVLRRLLATRPQTELNRSERRRNIRNAFSLTKPAAVRGQHVLLVDDIYTTGATSAEAARVLKRGGAAKVGVLTVARASFNR